MTNRIFFGSVLNPTRGAWVNLDDYGDKDEFNEQLAKLEKEFGSLQDTEFSIMDHEGFLGFDLEGSTDIAWLMHELALETDTFEEFEALVAWAEYRGTQYTIQDSADTLREASDIYNDFQDELLAIAESEEDYAEEWFMERWVEDGGDEDTVTGRMIANHMNWERVARDLSCDGIVFLDIKSGGVAVFSN